MTRPDVRRASLTHIRTMKDRGEIRSDQNAPEGGEDLGPEFWSKATVKGRTPRRSVLLKVDQDVFDFFVAETGGKGHITRMQEVLRAYADTHGGKR